MTTAEKGEAFADILVPAVFYENKYFVKKHNIFPVWHIKIYTPEINVDMQ